MASPEEGENRTGRGFGQAFSLRPTRETARVCLFWEQWSLVFPPTTPHSPGRTDSPAALVHPTPASVLHSKLLFCAAENGGLTTFPTSGLNFISDDTLRGRRDHHAKPPQAPHTLSHSSPSGCRHCAHPLDVGLPGRNSRARGHSAFLCLRGR